MILFGVEECFPRFSVTKREIIGGNDGWLERELKQKCAGSFRGAHGMHGRQYRRQQTEERVGEEREAGSRTHRSDFGTEPQGGRPKGGWGKNVKPAALSAAATTLGGGRGNHVLRALPKHKRFVSVLHALQRLFYFFFTWVARRHRDRYAETRFPAWTGRRHTPSRAEQWRESPRRACRH